MTTHSRQWWLNILLLTLPVAILAIQGYRLRWVSEDAFITLRVAENLLDGHGPVFNVGERVEVYTHPLWLAALAIWGLPGLPLPEGAAYLGLLCAVAGLAFGLAGAAVIWQRATGTTLAGPGQLLLPLGALIFIAIPPVWDFASSGLETGLTFGWLGFSFWLLARRVCRHSGRTGYAMAFILGLGILVRPDLFIYTVAFLLVLLAAELTDRSRSNQLKRAMALVGVAAALPVLYQIFRMGYFAALVSNTAIAKEASWANWRQGWRYLQDFVEPYWLWLPVLILLAWLGWRLLELAGDRKLLLTGLLVAPVVAASVHTVYVVRLGGDFMHGRMLLPAFFALLLPVMAVPVTIPARRQLRSIATWGTVGIVLVWAAVCGFWLRWPGGVEINDWGIADERAVYVDLTGNPHPMTLSDHEDMRLGWVADGRLFHDLAGSNPRMLLLPDGEQRPLRSSVDAEVALVAVVGNVGLTGFAAGDGVYLVDFQGISDPIASRMTLEQRGRPGHEKFMPPLWARARFEDEASLAAADSSIRTAAAVLSCGEIADLREAIAAPLTPGRFLRNILISPRLTTLRIAQDPYQAQAEYCP